MLDKCLRAGGLLLRQQSVPAAGLAGSRHRSTQLGSKLDPVQESLLQEPCILVNEEDEIIGQARIYIFIYQFIYVHIYVCILIFVYLFSQIRENTQGFILVL